MSRPPLLLPRGRALALAVVAGLVFSLAFQATPRPWLGALGLAPLIWLLRAPRPFWNGLAFGAAFWLGSMSWIVGTLEVYGGAPPGLSHFLLLLLALYLGLDFAVFAWVAAPIWRRGGAAPFLALPALWLLIEWLRAFPFGGFPWNLLAHSWLELPGALPVAAWIGAFGVSALVVLVNVVVADQAERRERWPQATAVLLTVTLTLVFAGRFREQEPGPLPSAGESLPAAALAAQGPDGELDVRILQPNSTLAHDEETLLRNYQTLITMARTECRPGVLLIWPESAAWPFRVGYSPKLDQDLRDLRMMGCRIVLNSAEQGEDGWRNVAQLLGPTGVEGEYAKRRLVPFGEYVPLGRWLPFVSYLARNAGEFVPGRELGLLPVKGARLAPAICYEVVFAAPVAEQVRAGAGLLLTITNDAWYGDTAAPWQHLAAARFRAAENGRPLLRAALTGVSAIVDSRGAVFGQLGVGDQGVLRARVPAASGLTLFTRAPWLPMAVAALALAFVIIRLRLAAHAGR